VVIEGSRTAKLTSAFAGVVCGYWLHVLPEVRAQMRRWRELAASIPDPALRELACATHAGERGNLEGAAAFATLAAADRRLEVVRAAVAFQALYDYLDTLAEAPWSVRACDAGELHRPLRDAVDARGSSPAAYARSLCERRDGGYVGSLVHACREALLSLPGLACAQQPALEAVGRMIAYQQLVHHDGEEGEDRLRLWAESLAGTPAGERYRSCDAGAPAASAPGACTLHWWELAAAGASSLGLFALLAAASRASLSPARACAIERAYFPWIGALHVLLDSLVDREADTRTGHHSLVGHYADERHAAQRLALLAGAARGACDTLPGGARDEVVLAAMVSFYLGQEAALEAAATGARRATLAAIGPLSTVTLRAHHVTRAAALHQLRATGRLRKQGGRPATPLLESQV
jgi:tetraprenyl-beta-curcumene synthase